MYMGKKIWVVGRSYPQKNNNMKGSFELEQAHMLADAGYDTTYVAVVFHPYKKIKKWGFSSFQDKKVKVFAFSFPFFPERMNIQWRAFRKIIWKHFVSKIKKIQGLPDIVHVHYPAMLIYDGVEILQKQGTKVVCTEHWSKVLLGTLHDKNRKHLKEFVQKCDAMICVGSPLRDSLIHMTGTSREIHVVPNIVSSAFMYKERMDNGNTFKFVAVGRLVKGKRFDLLIYAFSAAFKGDTKIVLDIIGDGDQRKYLEECIGKSGCADQIHLLGLMGREDIANYYSRCDAMVLSSELETFGVPIIEAMACGLPVITTDAIGFIEYMNVDNSIVVEKNNKEQMTNALIQMHSDIMRYDRKAISEYAKEYFSSESICKKLTEIYDDLEGQCT